MGHFDAFTFGATMLSPRFQPIFSNSTSQTIHPSRASPWDESLDNLRKPWAIQEIHEAGQSAMMRLLQIGHR
jgi:hypothetical protein